MRKLFIAILTAITATAGAQTMYVCQPTGMTSIDIASVGKMTVSESAINILGTSYSTNDIDSLVLTKPAMTVKVAFGNGTATVENNTGGIVRVLKNTDGHVALFSNAENNAEEIEYIVSGSGSDNSLYIEGSYKLTLTLNGVQITNPDSAAIRVKCGKRINVVVADGTTNTLADAANNSDNSAAFWIKGHAEFKGAGTLTVTGNNSHAIKTGEYCQLNKKFTGTITIPSSANDGLHCGDYFKMNNGTLTISNTKGDALQADTNDVAGYIEINGGTLNVEVDTEDAKGIKCDSVYTQTGGTVSINVPDGVLSGKGTDFGGAATLSGGTITATVAANGGKGIKGDSSFTMTGGTITMNVSGGKDSENDSNCFGVKLDGDWTQTGGAVSINVSNSKARAIKSNNTTTDKGSSYSKSY